MSLIIWLHLIPLLIAEQLDPTLVQQINWWQTWPDQKLVVLIEESLTNSPDVKISQARMSQSRAIAGQLRAGYLPSLSASWSSNTQPRDALGFGFGLSSIDDLVPDIPGAEPEEESDEIELFTSGTAALRVDLPLDIWGGGYANYKAAVIDSQAAAENQRGALYAFSIAVANAYYDLLMMDQQLHIVTEEIEVARDLLAVTKLRHERGEASVLDVLQQEQQLASASTQIPRGQQQLRLAEQRLLVLLGRQPSGTVSITKDFPGLSAFTQQDLDKWVVQRPDVREAAYTLEAAEKRRYRALVSMFPSLSLGGQLSRQSNYVLEEWDTLNAWSVSTGASVTLFQGGNKMSALRSASAGVFLAEENLKKVTLGAQQEVAQIVLAEETQSSIVDASKIQLDAAKRAFEEAERQYIQGLIPFATLLTTQRAYQQAQINDLQSKREQVRTRLQSYVALGISQGDSND